MRRLAEHKRVVNRWRELERKMTEVAELISLAEEDSLQKRPWVTDTTEPASLVKDDTALRLDIQSEVDRLSSLLDELELERAFSDKYDTRGAILTIHAGAGGTESQDWAEMLLRMYLRWAERRGYEAEILDISPGEEAGIKSAIVSLKGSYAHGYLKSEHGVHRLVRLSPFDADHARHTSFALVEVMPEAEEDVDVVIDPDELKIDVFRSSGPGGQHMQKNATAVRITHKPTNIVVSCQSERSQTQNREMALRVLHIRLYQRELERQQQEMVELRGEHVEAAWGNQIRSYVLHPYRMVKDLRTGHESGNPDAVLDGALDEFMEAFLRYTVGHAEAI